MNGQYSVLTIFQLPLQIITLTEAYSIMHLIIDHTALLITPLAEHFQRTITFFALHKKPQLLSLLTNQLCSGKDGL